MGGGRGVPPPPPPPPHRWITGPQREHRRSACRTWVTRPTLLKGDLDPVVLDLKLSEQRAAPGGVAREESPVGERRCLDMVLIAIRLIQGKSGSYRTLLSAGLASDSGQGECGLHLRPESVGAQGRREVA